MDITFNKVGELWEAEFEATADFNIHLERDRGGVFRVYQRTAGSQYALVDEVDKVYTQYKGVVDYDCSSLIFPKFIKIVSEVEPTYASIVSSGEITEIKSQAKSIEITSNGTTEITPDAGFAYLNKVSVKTNVAQSGGGSTWRYFDTTHMYAPSRDVLVSFAAALVRIDSQGIIAGGGALATLGLTSSAVNAVAVIPTAEVIMDGQTTVIEYVLTEMASDLVEITKEEFYNLDNGGGK